MKLVLVEILPAKLFNHTEKGRDKYRYSKRLVFWEKIAEMIRSGWTSTDAINKVINHYVTNLSITKIMLTMQKDRHKKNYLKIEKQETYFCLHIKVRNVMLV